MEQKELNFILENHKKWLKGNDGERANLRNANLSGANLNSADLRDANLKGADLRCADLRCANLRGSDLEFADLRGADLREANLSNANLNGANLRYADLREANLRCAYLIYTDLRCVDLREAKNVPFIPYACPDTGAFIGYKKSHGYIVELEILQDARRCSATGRKCRCDKAKVLSIQYLDGNIAIIDSVSSEYDSNFIYTVGEIVEEPNYNEDRWAECSEGIHFFINRQEAVDY